MIMNAIPDYFEQVYAGVLGKVIGVYMGRPFEGWTRDAIEARWGVVDHYVHHDRGVPLVVADDDISGTFTFVRALEDSGLGVETPADFFGDTWLNYLIENRTILWWGGVGHSTEHTAYARLKRGVRAPESGSAARNGRVVSAHAVRDDESIISITSDGLMVRQRVVDITVVGRGAQGVRLVRLTEGATLVSVSVVAAEEVEESTAATSDGAEG